MSKTKTKTTEKALPAVANEIAGIFSPIDFESLNASITKLAESGGNLSPEEKKFAIDIVDEWDQNVIKAIDDKITEGTDILYSLDPDSYRSDCMDEEMIAKLAKQLGNKTASLYKAYEKTKGEVLDIQKQKPDYDKVRDASETAEEYIDRASKSEAEYAKWELKIAKARKRADWALYELKREIYGTTEAQEIIKRIKSFQRKSSSFKKSCNEKSRLAKINITISDETAREALKELISFKI